MASEFTEQSYYPSAKARLIIRLEEYAMTDVRAQAPKTPQIGIRGTSAVRGKLRVVEDLEGTVPRLRLTSEGAKTTGPGQAQSASKDERTQVIDAVIPKKAGWKQNGPRLPDKLTLTLRWSDFPIDPRCVRSCAVEYYLGTVSADDHARGIRGLTRGDLDPAVQNAKEPLNVVPDRYVDVHGQSRTNLRFLGWVDSYEMQWNDGEPVITLECLDNTKVLIDQTMPASGGLNPKKPIDRAVAEFLALFPTMDGLTVEYRPPPGATAQQQVAPALGVEIKAHQTPALPAPVTVNVAGVQTAVPGVGTPQHQTGGGAEGQTVWDYLVDNVSSLGLSLRVDGSAIVIDQVRSLIDRVRPDDPYRERRLESGAYPQRAMVFGRNITDLRLKRSYARPRPQNVEVRSYVVGQKKSLVARWPPYAPKPAVGAPTAAGRATDAGPGDGRVDQPWKVRKVAGITDQATLLRIAKNLYEGASRQEIQATLKTRNLGAFGGANEDPDLLDVKIGDVVEVLTDRKAAGTIATLEERNRRTGEFLVAQGYSRAFAEQYVRTLDNKGLQRLFVLKESSIDWDCDSGVELELTCVNYVVVRADAGSGE